jgi:bromodomain-containing protein 7/9
MDSDSDSAESSSSGSSRQSSQPPAPPPPKPVIKLKFNFAKHAAPSTPTASSSVAAVAPTPKLKLKRPLQASIEAGPSTPGPSTPVQRVSIKLPKSKGKGKAKASKAATPRVVSNPKSETSTPSHQDGKREATTEPTDVGTPGTGTPTEGGPMDVDFEHDETSTPGPDSASAQHPYQRKYWARLKKPLSELVRKIVIEIRRKDDVRLPMLHHFADKLVWTLP